jgi:hypothetical protein
VVPAGRVTAELHLINSGDVPAHLEEVTSSCGCLSVEIDRDQPLAVGERRRWAADLQVVDGQNHIVSVIFSTGRTSTRAFIRYRGTAPRGTVRKVVDLGDIAVETSTIRRVSFLSDEFEGQVDSLPPKWRTAGAPELRLVNSGLTREAGRARVWCEIACYPERVGEESRLLFVDAGRSTQSVRVDWHAVRLASISVPSSFWRKEKGSWRAEVGVRLLDGAELREVLSTAAARVTTASHGTSVTVRADSEGTPPAVTTLSITVQKGSLGATYTVPLFLRGKLGAE